MRRRLRAALGSALLAAGLAGGAASTAWADALIAPAAATAVAQQRGPHAVYCQTPEYASYAKFFVYGMTPGGGPLCYTGVGTTRVDIRQVLRFEAGTHSGSFIYRTPGQPISRAVFRPGQVVILALPYDVLSLTL